MAGSAPIFENPEKCQDSSSQLGRSCLKEKESPQILFSSSQKGQFFGRQKKSSFPDQHTAHRNFDTPHRPHIVGHIVRVLFDMMCSLTWKTKVTNAYCITRCLGFVPPLRRIGKVYPVICSVCVGWVLVPPPPKKCQPASSSSSFSIIPTASHTQERKKKTSSHHQLSFSIPVLFWVILFPVPKVTLIQFLSLFLSRSSSEWQKNGLKNRATKILADVVLIV